MVGFVRRWTVVVLAVLASCVLAAPAGAQLAAPEAAQGPESPQSSTAPAGAAPAADPAPPASPEPAATEAADPEPKAVASSGTTARDAQADRDCADFDTQPEAQEYFDSQGGGPDNNVDQLDEDGDGVACENLDGATPDGGIDSGGGWLARRDAGTGAGAPLAALALLLAAAGGLAGARRLD